jgi:hypothetical protein
MPPGFHSRPSGASDLLLSPLLRPLLRQVNGIVPGYGGHIPRATSSCGRSSYGQIPYGSPTRQSRKGDQWQPVQSYGDMYKGLVPKIQVVDAVEGYTGHIPSRRQYHGQLERVTGNPARKPTVEGA